MVQSSTVKLEYEYFLEDGGLQGGTSGVPRLALRIPDSEAVPADWEDFALKKDLYFYLGTTQQFHSRGRNPFMIIGTFTPPLDSQLRLEF